MDSCFGCIQKIREQNAETEKAYTEAVALANQKGEWVGLYTDEYGQQQYILASLATGYNITRFAVPDMRPT